MSNPEHTDSVASAPEAIPETMKDRLSEAIKVGREVLAAEASAIEGLIPRLDETFTRAVRLVLDTSGRVVLTGMGKSGLIARKVAATFSSTGAPSFYLHPAEGVHGDLGAVTRDDLVIALSYSGETGELSAILPVLKRIPVPIVALVSEPDSALGRAADITLDVTVDREACPLGLAPTASTTAMLAMGDALAMAVMHARAFTREQFALYHPAGSLGRKLLTIDEVMRRDNENCLVSADSPLLDTLWSMTRAGLGAAIVVDESRRLLGIITDGDIRRKVFELHDLKQYHASDIMTPNPRVVHSGRLASEAVAIMQAPPRKLNVLPVVDDTGRVIGATHIQDLTQIGIV